MSTWFWLALALLAVTAFVFGLRTKIKDLIFRAFRRTAGAAEVDRLLSIHREVLVEFEVSEIVLLGEAFALKHFILELPLNFSKGDHRWLVAGDLE